MLAKEGVGGLPVGLDDGARRRQADNAGLLRSRRPVCLRVGTTATDEILEAGFGWAIILRLYATGLAFLALAKRYAFKPSSRLLGAITYAFTGYSLMVGVHHPFFLLPMIWLPLLFVGIDRIHTARVGLLALMTGVTILSNFYFAYILGLGSLITR